MLPEKYAASDVRKMLCGRLLYLDTVQIHNEKFSRCGAGDTLDGLRQSVFTYIDRYKGGGASASGFIKDLLAFLQSVGEPTLEPYPGALQVLQNAVAARKGMINCTGCSMPPSLPQAGQLSPGGCCKASLQEMFDFAVDVTKVYYGSYSSHAKYSPASVTLDVKLFRDRNRVHDLPIDYSVSGAVEFLPPVKGARSEVQLLLHVDNFDLDSYLTVPYVLFHECIAHAYHGLLPNANDRKPHRPDDQFAEGWMDFVAFEIFKEVWKGNGPAKHLLGRVKLTADHYDRSYKLHSSRIELSVKPPLRQSQYAICRRSGHHAARKVLRVLERTCPTEARAREIFFRMSFDLNMTQKIDSLQKNFFVAVINNLSEPGSPDSPRHCDVVRVMRKYIENNKLEHFVAEIVGLKKVWENKPRFFPPGGKIIH